MNTQRSSPPGDRESASEQALRELLERAGPREAPPEADAAEVRAALYAEWDVLTGRRVRLRRMVVSAAAAVLMAVAAWFVVDTGSPVIPATVARVERLQGPIAIRVDGEDVALRVGDAILEGATITTGSGLVALRLDSGGSLRLAPQSRMSVNAQSAVELERGALYFDSENARGGGEPLTIATTLGTVRDVGTQFMAEIDTSRFVVGVRDGDVLITRGADRVAATGGEKLTVRDNAAAIRREPIATFGDNWAWAERLAPPFDIDGRRLLEVLEWIAMQTGRTLEFGDPAAEQLARETELTGSIDAEPLPKLAAVLTLTDGLKYSIEGGRILISAK
jgi:hypothetical protein